MATKLDTNGISGVFKSGDLICSEMYCGVLNSVYNYSHLQQNCIIYMSIFCPSRLLHDFGAQYEDYLKYVIQ
jgi:hypothetical protein